MGSSSNTNTSGGGSDKDDKKEDKGKGKDSAEPSFKEGDRVLAYHGPLLYEAKVRRRFPFPSLPFLALSTATSSWILDTVASSACAVPCCAS